MKRQSSRSVSPLDAHIGFWMRFVSNRVSAEFEKAMESSGVSVSEWVALRTLYDGSLSTHGALMAALGMTKGAVSKVVSRLEEKGFVERVTGATDARSQGLGLTAAGRALVPGLAARADANDAQFFGHLSATRRNDLRALLEELARVHQLKEVPVA